MASKSKGSFLPPPAGPKVVPWLWVNETWHDQYPAVFELLCAGTYEGEARKPATLTLFVSEGRLKACIRDRQTRQNCWMTLEAVGDVIGEIEALLQAGKAEWRSDSKNGSMEGVL